MIILGGIVRAEPRSRSKRTRKASNGEAYETFSGWCIVLAFVNNIYTI